MRFPLFLTLSLLCSVSTLKAGLDDILDLPQEQKEGKLKRKLANLNRKIDSTRFNNPSEQPFYRSWTIKADALKFLLTDPREGEKIGAVENYKAAKREIGEIRYHLGMQKKGFISNKILVIDSDFQFHNYTINRYRVGNSAQYGFNMPKAPVVHPYHPGDEGIIRKNLGTPIFSFAAHQHGDELNPLVFPVFPEAQTILKQFGVLPENVDYFYVVQDNPWKKCQQLLRPQSWVFPDAPFSTPKPYSKGANIYVAVFSPLSSVKLVGSKERIQFLPGVISSHNSVDGKTGLGGHMVVSSAGDFPLLEGLKDNETDSFVSMVINPANKKAAITSHTILSDYDFAELPQKEIKDVKGLQDWNSSLFKQKYGIIGEGDNSIYAGVPWTPLAKDMLEDQREEIPFINPDFVLPTSSASSSMGSIPQGYTFVADPAQKRGTQVPLSVALREEGHVALRGDGYVFYYRLPTDVMKRLDKKSFAFEVDVLSNTPGAYIQYWGYQGIGSKKLQSTAHTGSGEWEKLRLNFTVDGSASQFFLYPAIMPGVVLGSTVPEVEIKGVKLIELKPLPLTYNPSFRGASPLGAIPQGYSLTLDPAQKRGTQEPLSVALREEGHVALRGDGYVFYYRLPTDVMKRLDQKSFAFEVDVLSRTPGAYIQYWGYRDPTSKKLKSTAHTGSGEWEKLRLNFTVDGNASQFFLYPAIMPGVELGSTIPEVEIKGVSLREIDQSLPVAFDLREIDRSLPVTFNPSFKGSSPSGAVPQGYRLDLDPAQKRGTKVPLSVALRGEGHVALTGDGYVFYYQLSKGELAQLAGQKVSFEADIRSDTAGAYIQYWDYPNSQKTQSARYDGKGEWETLRLDFTINPQQTMFFLYPAIMPGVKEGSSAPVVEVRNVRLNLL